ncbi:MAG TPA: MBL fold metallo-hydrolase [Gemmatimonadota bacterium]
MSEPREVATRAERVADGVWTWTVTDDRIGGAPSTTVAVEEARESLVLVNPLRLDPEELDRLGGVSALVLTGPSHVRAAPYYRELTGAPIWAPAGLRRDDLDPDETFADGEDVPGGLRAVALRGPSDVETAFHLARGAGVLIVGDALTNIPASGGLHLLPPPHNPDVAGTRRSARRLLELEFELVLFAHGDPLRERAKDRLREVIEG